MRHSGMKVGIVAAQDFNEIIVTKLAMAGARRRTMSPQWSR